MGDTGGRPDRVPGTYTWYVAASNADGHGFWSAGLGFVVTWRPREQPRGSGEETRGCPLLLRRISTS